MKLSRFVHIYKNDNSIALYDCLTQAVFMADNELWGQTENAIKGETPNSIIVKETIADLLRSDIIVQNDKEDQKRLSTILTTAPLDEVNIDNFKMILTNRCNLKCKYCVIEGNLKHGSNIDMDIETADRSLDTFAYHTRSSKHKDRMIMLYGGEPLLNWEVAKHVIDTIRQSEKTNRFGGKIDIVLETNGTLITTVIADHLATNAVLVQVSIDGPPRIHNQMRHFKDGRPSHAAAEEGFNIARNAGCTCVVSAVFGSHVADNVKEFINYFTTDLKPLTIGLDLLHLIQHEKNPAEVPIDKLISQYIRAWEYARDSGLYVEHIVRKLRPFVVDQIRWKDCQACGNRMVVRPDGQIGVCEAFLASGDYYSNSFGQNTPLPSDSVFHQWSRRSALTDINCRDCSALTLCGKGCGYNAHVKYGDFMKYDDKVCLVTQALLGWAIQDIARSCDVRDELQKNKWLRVSSAQKRKILKNVPLYADLSLNNISNFAEK